MKARWIGVSLLGLLSAIAPQSSVPSTAFRVLDASACPSGAVFVVASRNERELLLRVRRNGRETERVVPLPALPEGTRIADARVAPWFTSGETDEAIFALVLEHEGRFTYHYLIDAKVGESVLSDPIFESTAPPFRLTELRVPGEDADGLEITFGRGSMNRKGDLAGVEVLVFQDVCTPVPKITSGKSMLVDLRTGEKVPLGSKR